MVRALDLFTTIEFNIFSFSKGSLVRMPIEIKIASDPPVGYEMEASIIPFSTRSVPLPSPGRASTPTSVIFYSIYNSESHSEAFFAIISV